MKRLLLTIAAIVASGLVIGQEAKPPTHEWSYIGEEGPQHWGELKPEYSTCRTGHLQSPIDIQETKKAPLPPIRFDYKPSALKIINNGHSIQVNYAPGSFILVGDKHYQLRQFHFHHPSEERIQGREYPMVIHLVHSDADGHLAVVAVLLTGGAADSAVQKVWDNLPKNEGNEETIPGVEINASDLLPQSRGYYTFKGSLTTPPCSEGVTWLVLKTPREVSPNQVQAFSKLYPHNARPIQPLNGRVVSESDWRTGKSQDNR